MTRTQISLVLAGLLGALVSGSAMAADATVTTTATVATAITLGTPTNINFGTVIVTAPESPASYTLATDGTTGTLTNLTLPGSARTVGLIPIIAGSSGVTFTVTTGTIVDNHPTKATVTNVTYASGTNTTLVTNAGNTTGTLSASTGDFKVGATLNILANAGAGTYTSSIPLTVQYQ